MTNLVPTPIQVNLTHYDKPDVLLEAWKASRPSVEITENNRLSVLSEILNLDLPVLEMVHLTLECKVPVILREIITTLRDHIMWARTSRVDNITDHWDIYEAATETSEQLGNIYSNMHKMETMIEQGKSQDEYRKVLPLTYMTSFTFKVSLRTLGKLMCHLHWISMKYTTGVLSTLYHDFNEALIQGMMSLESDSYQAYRVFLINSIHNKHVNFNSYTPFEKESVYKDDNILVFNVKNIPIGLRAQLIRSRTLIVSDNLLDKFAQEDHLADNTMTLDMSIASSKQFFLQLISKRNCWVAQKDLWQPILDLLSNELGDDVVLPCSGGECPFKKDCFGRLDGTDPGIPCPMNYIQNIKEAIKVKELSKEDIAKIQQYALDTTRCSALVKASNHLAKAIESYKSKGELIL